MASSRRNKKEKEVLPSRPGPEQQSFEFDDDNVLHNNWSRWKILVLPLLRQYLCRLLPGRRRRRRTTTTTTHQRQHQRQSSLAIVIRRILFVSCFLSLYSTVSYHLDQKIENDYHANEIAMTKQYNRQRQERQEQQQEIIIIIIDDEKHFSIVGRQQTFQ
jgi:hypothetical protein